MVWSKIFIVCLEIFILSKTICASSIILGPGDNRTIKCVERKCIPKCCPSGQYVIDADSSECSDIDQPLDYYNITLYETFKKGTIVLDKVNKTLGDIFYLVPDRFNEIIKDNTTFAENYPFIAETAPPMKSFLTETGELYMEFPNNYELWRPVKHFCFDYVYDYETDKIGPFYLLVFLNDNTEAGLRSYYYYYFLISCVFLALVFLVYIVLPELRNLGGMILMAYISSLFMGFALLAKIQSKTQDCVGYTASIYFFLLAAFCWMNIMSVDIWWTFRGYAKARPIHRRGERFKFCMYCLYGWGVPGLMTIGMVMVNAADLSDTPWIIKPLIPSTGCFLEDGQELVYLYIPMLILILSNWIFFLMTAYNIRRLMRGTAVLNSAAAGNAAAHQKQRNRLLLYLKLSVVMGINWLLEVVSFFKPELKVWQVSDTYNLLIGFAIFVIFVCKKKIYKRLIARFYELRSTYFGGTRPTWTLTKSSTCSSTLESKAGEEIPMQVSNNPMPEQKMDNKKNLFTFN